MTATAFPRVIFDAPLLRGLDDRGRQELMRSGRLRELSADDLLYEAGTKGDALYVVAEGEVALTATRRNDGDAGEHRVKGVGESFGEEASIGATYRASARAAGPCRVAELPVALFRRAIGRVGGHAVAERFERRLRRRATAELLATSAFTAQLSEDDRELLLDAAEHREVLRGEVLYRAGEPATHLWLVADGMVQLQTTDEERLRVQAYLVRGDFFGDEELVTRIPREETAVASGASLLVAIPAEVARTVADRNPELLRKLRRVRLGRQEGQHELVATGETQHAFRDLYRLSVARSLLVIDLDSCVRCGHCAWSCESLHGVARLVRRGDKIVTKVGAAETASPLLLPNSCQHCETPACMPDCPTGAIGRDRSGEVFIRDELCTGCGACAKGCPWDNIQIVPRPPQAKRPAGGVFDDLAVKCDLCRGYAGPACVEACPTASIFRLDPTEDLPEVARMLRREGTSATERRGRLDPWLAGLGAFAAALGIVFVGLHQRGSWVPWRGPGFACGVAALLSLLGLSAYVVPKRLRRLWAHRGERTREVGSRQRVQVRLHVALGFGALALALGHAGGRFTASSGGLLATAFWGSALIGLLGWLAYAFFPPLLARIERQAVLPEDYPEVRRELTARLYDAVTGRSELTKRLFEKVLVPYLRRPFGWLGLIASRRDLAAEQRRLRARIDRILEGRGQERLAGLEQLIRLVVELRALRGQRVLTALLRIWLPLHVALAGVALALLVIHLVEVLR
ncbi:MAG: cyclic nucleotide-binding domain-containing protein [Polyangiaceae bacterium]